MKVFVISEADYDFTTIHGVARSFDEGVSFVKSMYKQKSLRLEKDERGVSAIWHGGATYYAIEGFDLPSPQEGRE